MSPKSPEDLNTPTTEANEKKSLRTRDKFIGVGAAAALALGLAGCGDGDNVNATPSPSETVSTETPTSTETNEPTAEPSPDVSPSDPETGIDHEGFYIPAGLSDKETAGVFIEIAHDWAHYGVHDNLRKEYSSWSMELNLPAGDETMQKYATMIAEENASIFVDALLIDDWQSNPNLVEYVENRTNANSRIIKNNLIRQAQKGPEYIMPKPYNIKIKGSVLSEDGSARTIDIYDESETEDGSKKYSGITVLSLNTVGDVEKISDISFHSTQQIR